MLRHGSEGSEVEGKRLRGQRKEAVRSSVTSQLCSMLLRHLLSQQHVFDSILQFVVFRLVCRAVSGSIARE